jgi:hypothetical protein
VVETIEAYRTEDGRVFTDVRDAVTHQAGLTLRQIDNPRLTSSIPAILESADEVLMALIPLLNLPEKPPLTVVENHPDEGLALTAFGEAEPYGYIDENGGFRRAGTAA